MIYMDVTLDNKTIRLTENGKRYARLKHLHEISGKSIMEEYNGHPLYPAAPNQQIGVPSVFRGIAPNKSDWCWFTKEWQEYAYHLILLNVRRKKPNLIPVEQEKLAKRIFAVGYRDNAFHTNNTGSWTHRDWINGSNLTANDMKLQYQFCAGNVVEVIGDKQRIQGGFTAYPVRCFNGSLPPPKLDRPAFENSLQNPLVQWATIETRIRTSNGKREIRPFDLVGVSEFPFVTPCYQSDVLWITEDRLRFITFDEFVSNNPYK